MNSALAADLEPDDRPARLRERAKAGDLEAKTALGRELVSSTDAEERHEGTAWIKQAAEEGSGEATQLLAAITASGIGLRQDWQAAFDHLRRAAEWRRLRGAINLGLWRPAVGKPVFSAPRIGIAENFAPPAICDWLIERSRARLERAEIADPASGLGTYASARTNSSAEFKLGNSDVILHLVRARIAALTGPPVEAMEGPSVLHYGVGEEFFRHYDFLDVSHPGYEKQVAEYGQRVLTFLLYLNDDFEGGETEFSALNWRYKGRKGDALFFWNVDPKGVPDFATLHAGLPPSRGEKWLFSQWVRGRV